MNKNKWFKFVLLYLVGMLIALGQLKVVPVGYLLAQQLQVSLTHISWLNSIFTFFGLFIAIPGAAIITWLGARKLLLLIILALILGNLLATLGNNFYWLLFTRALEGISFATIIMVAIVLINHWFKGSSHTGLAIGIFTTFPATGSLIAMNLFVPLRQHYGYLASWYLIGILAILLLIACYFFIDDNEQSTTVSKKQPHYIRQGFIQAMKNRHVWLLGSLQGCMAFVLYTFIFIYPLLFTHYYHLSITKANFYSSLFGLFGLPFGILAGYLIDKTQRPKLIIFIAFTVLAIATTGTLMLANLPVLFVIQLFLLSSACSLASSSILITAPKLVNNQADLSYSISIINLFYYACIVIGPPLVTRVIETVSWSVGIGVLSVVALTGVLISLLLLKVRTLTC